MRVTDPQGSVLRSFLYANGRPLASGTEYFRYDWHGNAAATVYSSGGGGTNWDSYTNVYGVWGENYDYGISYYNWNAASGYLRFKGKINFDLNEALDIGLYYVHGRWYNQDTGLFLSPNEKGDYFYGGDGQDPVNKGWIALASDPGDYICNTKSGCFVNKIPISSHCTYSSSFRPTCNLDTMLSHAVSFYSDLYGIPTELLATTLLVEDQTDNLFNSRLAQGTKDWVASLGASNANNVLGDILLGLFNEYARQKGEPGPAAQHFHTEVAANVQSDFRTFYPNSAQSNLLGIGSSEARLLGILSSTDGVIRFAAAYLRDLADIRKFDLRSPHLNNLSDIDQAVIYQVYRSGVRLGSCQETPGEFQTSDRLCGHGKEFLQYLAYYKNYYLP